MSDIVSAEISIKVGELPNTPGFKVSARLGMGPEHSNSIKNTFKDKSNQELEDLTFNLVIVAKTEDGAEVLYRLIKKVIDQFLSDKELPGAPSKLREIFAHNDSDEYNGAPKFVATTSLHRNNVIVHLKPIEGFREQLQAQLEMVTGLAGDVLERNQEVYFEFDLGKTFGDVSHSEHALVDLFESLCFKLWVHLHPQIFNDLTNLANNMGAPAQVSLMMNSANLFNNAKLAFNFKSASKLASEHKQIFESVSQRFHQNVINKQIPDNVKRFFKYFANNGTGNIHFFAGYQNIAAFADLHLPGVSQFLSE